ncbi:MAG: RidA family protein [Dehalococcoidia bacterium]|nr:RidA family protein [Dehalococcoidia bacterium]
MTSDIEGTVVETRGVARPLGAYNHAVSVRPGRLVFIAGQVAVSEGGDVVGAGDLSAQTRQVFQNLEQILSSAGATFENVVQFTTYLVSSQSVENFIAARTEIFPRIFPNGNYPTNTLLVIDRLVREEFLIEIEAIAALP